jgi:hypothetical protein
MENLTRKSNFRSAYQAGRKEYESRRQPLSILGAIGGAAAFILAREGAHLLAARLQLAGFEKTLLDDGVPAIVFSAYFLWVWRIIPVKRNKT